MKISFRSTKLHCAANLKPNGASSRCGSPVISGHVQYDHRAVWSRHS